MKTNTSTSEIIHKPFLNQLLTGNKLACSEFANQYYSENKSIHQLYENIFKPALYDVGLMWENNKISVATEHLASAIVETLLNEFYPHIITKDKTNKKVIVACVEKEYHQIGIKMVSDIFEMNGWITYFLGANTPTNELISFAKTIQPNLLAISLSIYFHIPILEKMINKIRQDFPDLTILVGGQAFRHGGQEVLQQYKNVVFLPDLYSTELFIKSYNHNGSKISS